MWSASQHHCVVMGKVTDIAANPQNLHWTTVFRFSPASSVCCPGLLTWSISLCVLDYSCFKMMSESLLAEITICFGKSRHGFSLASVWLVITKVLIKELKSWIWSAVILLGSGLKRGDPWPPFYTPPCGVHLVVTMCTSDLPTVSLRHLQSSAGTLSIW